jgi:hypothetical protein
MRVRNAFDDVASTVHQSFLPGTARYVVKQLPTLGNNAVAGRVCQMMRATSFSTLWTLIST